MQAAMTIEEELLHLVQTLETASKPTILEQSQADIDRLNEAAERIGKSFSGSWLGYHSRVYYSELKPPPPGAHFSREWGLDNAFGMGTSGEWREVDRDSLKDHIYEQAGRVDLSALREERKKAEQLLHDAKAELESILSNELAGKPDPFIEKLQTDLGKLNPLTAQQVARAWAPQGQIITRDMVALGQGSQIPPHIEILAEVRSLRHSFAICASAADIARKAASHLGRKTKRFKADARIGTNVFIGHGRAPAWRELKDFVQDRLKLPWDEFNRVPVAGVTNIARLSEMLDSAAIALLVMTAEDETAEGVMRARENVVHEVGLFQGRLGFSRALVLLEEGCEEFSNIQGLGQIRFPAGKISSAFEEVRQVMEREGLVTE